jgi:hypothetical protein
VDGLVLRCRLVPFWENEMEGWDDQDFRDEATSDRIVCFNANLQNP